MLEACARLSTETQASARIAGASRETTRSVIWPLRRACCTRVIEPTRSMGELTACSAEPSRRWPTTDSPLCRMSMRTTPSAGAVICTLSSSPAPTGPQRDISRDTGALDGRHPTDAAAPAHTSTPHAAWRTRVDQGRHLGATVYTLFLRVVSSRER